MGGVKIEIEEPLAAILRFPRIPVIVVVADASPLIALERIGNARETRSCSSRAGRPSPPTQPTGSVHLILDVTGYFE